MKSKLLKIAIAACALGVQLVMILGCASDHDPHEKVNDPGYYNGPMKAHGANAGGNSTPTGGTTGPG